MAAAGGPPLVGGGPEGEEGSGGALYKVSW